MESANRSASVQPVKQSSRQIVDRQLVVGALQTLSSEHRQVLLECYFRGASVADAAQTLGVPSDRIKTRTHEALHALRRAIVEAAAVP